MPKKTRDHESWLTEKLSDPGRAASYLNAALEDSPQMFLEALRDGAQARKMTKVAKDAGQETLVVSQHSVDAFFHDLRRVFAGARGYLMQAGFLFRCESDFHVVKTGSRNLVCQEIGLMKTPCGVGAGASAAG